MSPEVTVVCPMYNEAAAIGGAVAKLKRCLDDLPQEAEVLLVNDGSQDATVDLALQAIAGDRRFRILSHRVNFGRGRALRTGFREARGDIIVTTEGDLSWGPEVIGNLVEFLRSQPEYDAVFASPHLPGGGYRNVPGHRVWLSSAGNRLLRFLYTRRLTMTTGMTRAYRARVIQPHLFSQDGKELHLEISHRLLALGYRIGEIPATLTWPEDSAAKAGRARRTNWGKLFKLVGSHVAFGVIRGISHVIGPAILLLTAAIVFFGGWALLNLLAGAPSIFLALLTGVLVILWVNLVVGFFLLYHTLQIHREVWETQTLILGRSARDEPSDHLDYYFEVIPQARRRSADSV